MAVLVGGLVALSAVLPPEHGHADSHGRMTVVHRHASMHAVQATWPVSLRGTEAFAIRTDSGYLAAAGAPRFHADATPTVRTVPDPPVAPPVGAPVADGAVSIHGPPSPPFAPRPPPASTVL